MKFTKEIEAALRIKDKSKQFNQLWSIRQRLAAAGQMLSLGDVDDWQKELLMLDQALVSEHAMPFYLARGNPKQGYAERFKGLEHEVHITCNKSGVSSAVTNAQLGAFCVFVQNMINDIHWADYYDGDLDAIEKAWSNAIAKTNLA